MWGDVYWDINYYRQLWIACLMAPFGTILRWKLSTLNGKWGKYSWFPVGTWIANFTGSIISAALTAVAYLQLVKGKDCADVLAGLSLGFAGSLSTVSTYAKEIVELSDKHPPYSKKAFAYSYFTIFSCCFVGLLVYSPIVRHAA
jgi:fluoride ion exporter CrcB/FEX